MDYEDKFYRASSFLFFNPLRKLLFFKMYNTDESVYKIGDYKIQEWEKANLPKVSCRKNSEDPYDLLLTSNLVDSASYIIFSNYEHNITLQNGWADTIYWPRLYGNYGSQFRLINGSVSLEYQGYNSFLKEWKYEDYILYNENEYYLTTESVSATSGYAYSATSGCFYNTTELSGDTFEFDEGVSSPGTYTGGETSETQMLFGVNGMQLI